LLEVKNLLPSFIWLCVRYSKMADLKISDDEGVRKVGQYILGETLGKGGYSWVKKGLDENTKVKVALKFMARARKNWEKEQAQQVRTEIKSLMRINHPNVLKLYAYNLNCYYPEKTGGKLQTILLVLEYCPGGELFDILYYTNQLDPTTSRTYFIQMIKAIKACHDVGIVHRDIKPQNLLLDGAYQLKLTDFGLSFLGKEGVDVEKITMKTSYVGTRGYQAPELLKREPYHKACDIFSAGVVLFILLTGYPPFEQAIKSDKWYNPLARGDVEGFWKRHKGCGIDDPECQDLISKMMAYRAYKRPSIDEILEHPWVAGSKAKVYDPKELRRILRERHRSARNRRRRDKKKMSEMRNSVKKRAMKLLSNKLDLAEIPPCPIVAVEEYVPTFMSFFTKAEHLEEAYSLARNIFDLAFESKAFTTSEVSRWTFTTAIRACDDNENSLDYLVQTCIVGLEGLKQFSFTFKRLRGDPLGFGKIWTRLEALLLSWRSADGKDFLFYDDYTPIFEDDLVNSDVDRLQTKTVIGAEKKMGKKVSVIV